VFIRKATRLRKTEKHKIVMEFNVESFKQIVTETEEKQLEFEGVMNDESLKGILRSGSDLFEHE
jgi:hypothetical protein